MQRMLVIDNSLSVRESLRIIFQDVFHVKTTDPWQDILSLLIAEHFDNQTLPDDDFICVAFRARYLASFSALEAAAVNLSRMSLEQTEAVHP